MSEEPTKVCFRLLEGEVIALFPEVPYNGDRSLCMSYQHVGQHGAASVSLCTELKAANKVEYGPLKAELESLGYVVDVRRRMTADMHYERARNIISAAKKRRNLVGDSHVSAGVLLGDGDKWFDVEFDGIKTHLGYFSDDESLELCRRLQNYFRWKVKTELTPRQRAELYRSTEELM